MGVVYEAYDRRQHRTVALKTLRELDAQHVLLFKNEFRALQDVQHPNLVQLGELFEESGRWFFTMELVRGVTLLRYVRPSSASRRDASETTSASPESSALDPRVEPRAMRPGMATTSAVTVQVSDSAFRDLPTGQWIEESPVVSGALHLDRLGDALSQLARGLLALHERGKVHRDIKPSNVLVEGEGKVVLLDFGLVTDAAQARRLEDPLLVGTPFYMAPEQARGGVVGPAADWYSVGVMLYQALTGKLPFVGTPREMLYARLRTCPQPPSLIDSSVPLHLDELCMALFEADPRDRADGEAVLEAFGASAPRRLPSSKRPFIGRSRELRALDEAFAEVRDGPVTVAIRGQSGVGKTELLETWAASMWQMPEVLVLQGRCYERESVPFKALDGALDLLGRELQQVHDGQLDSVLPRQRALLGQVFPALRRVEAIASAPENVLTLAPREQRQQLFTALRELFEGLSRSRRLVLLIDDFQWADGDSIAALTELMRSPDGPNLLLVVSEREGPGSGKVSSLAARLDDVRRLRLGPLPYDEALSLVCSLLPDGARAVAAALVEEAAGHPLFIHELIQQQAATSWEPTRPRQLEEVLWTRALDLDLASRRLLEVTVMAAGPLTQALALEAAGLSASRGSRLFSLLRSERFVTTTGPDLDDLVEPYHGRVRQAVLPQLGPERRAELHRALAEAMERADAESSPEALATHWVEAGEPQRASRHAEVAARRALKSFAFERAARLFHQALDNELADPRRRFELRVAMGEALADAGRGAQSAAAFHEASKSAVAGEAFDLRRRAAEQWLRSGYVDAGLDALREVLDEVGLELSSSRARSLSRLTLLRARVRLDDLRSRPLGEVELAPATSRRLDACWTAAVGLAMIDPVRGAEFQSRLLLEARRVGDVGRTLRALALELGHRSAAGVGTRDQVDRLARRAADLAEQLDRAYARGLAIGGAGVAAFLQGRFELASRLCDQAADLYREQCTGATWEQDTAEIVAAWSLFYTGHVTELKRRLPRLLTEAVDRGDRFASTSLRTGILCWMRLAMDEPERARIEADEAIEGWSEPPLLHQHWDHLLAQAEIDLYLGDGVAALDRLERRWESLRRALVFTVQVSRAEANFLRGRAALMAAADAPRRRLGKLRDIAATAAKRLVREGGPWLGMGTLLEAGLVAREGYAEGAAALLRQAERSFQVAQMDLHAAACRWQRGRILSGDRRDELIADAEAALFARGMQNPPRAALALAPGFDGYEVEGLSSQQELVYDFSSD